MRLSVVVCIPRSRDLPTSAVKRFGFWQGWEDATSFRIAQVVSGVFSASALHSLHSEQMLALRRQIRSEAVDDDTGAYPQPTHLCKSSHTYS